MAVVRIRVMTLIPAWGSCSDLSIVARAWTWTWIEYPEEVDTQGPGQGGILNRENEGEPRLWCVGLIRTRKYQVDSDCLWIGEVCEAICKTWCREDKQKRQKLYEPVGEEQDIEETEIQR